MKWSIEVAFEIHKGRRKVFSLRNLVPLFKRWHREHKNRCRSCYGKTRYQNEQHAVNAEWFKKRPMIYHTAYLCEVCDGWHITTQDKR